MQGTVIYPPWNRFQYVPACDFPVHHVSDNISIYRHKNALFSIMECHTTLLLTKELILQKKKKVGQCAHDHESYHELHHSETKSRTDRMAE